MPNRMIKDSMLSSDKIASLTDFEFRLWIGLILSVDDMGRGDARAAIIKGRVFPLRDWLTTQEIGEAVQSLAAKGCISLYEVGRRPYFCFPTWSRHQRIREIRPKFPGPPDVQTPCGVYPAEETINPALRGVSSAAETIEPALRGVSSAAETDQPALRGVSSAAETGQSALRGVSSAAETDQPALRGTLPQSAAGCRTLPRSAAICRASPQSAADCRASPQSAADCRASPPETKTKPNQTEPYDETEPPADAGSPVVDVVVRAVGELNARARRELGRFLESMGEDCVIRAVEAAQDAGKPIWGYVRGILENKLAQGVHSCADWDRIEGSFRAGRGGTRGAIAGTPVCVQPDARRIQQNSQWLDDFLAGEEKNYEQRIHQ